MTSFVVALSFHFTGSCWKVNRNGHEGKKKTTKNEILKSWNHGEENRIPAAMFTEAW